MTNIWLGSIWITLVVLVLVLIGYARPDSGLLWRIDHNIAVIGDYGLTCHAAPEPVPGVAPRIAR